MRTLEFSRKYWNCDDWLVRAGAAARCLSDSDRVGRESDSFEGVFEGTKLDIEISTAMQRSRGG